MKIPSVSMNLTAGALDRLSIPAFIFYRSGILGFLNRAARVEFPEVVASNSVVCLFQEPELLDRGLERARSVSEPIPLPVSPALRESNFVGWLTCLSREWKGGEAFVLEVKLRPSQPFAALNRELAPAGRRTADAFAPVASHRQGGELHAWTMRAEGSPGSGATCFVRMPG